MRLTKGIFLLLFLCLMSVVTFGQRASFFYQAPMDDSRYLNPEQNLILKTRYGFDMTTVHPGKFILHGSQSGNADLTLHISEDSVTLLVIPKEPFRYGETVSVSILAGMKDREGNFLTPRYFRFHIRQQPAYTLLKDYRESEWYDFRNQEPATAVSTGSAPKERDNNLPATYPAPTVTWGDNHVPDDQYVFMNMISKLYQVYDNYLTIVDDYGTPVYYKKTALSSRDFRVLDNGWLTYSNNDLSNPANEKYYLVDSAFRIFDSVMMGNGYYVDGHDMLYLHDGHYLLMAYDPQLINMNLIVPGGQTNATVVGLVIQEVDLDQQVYFQWRSWDHFAITDATYDIDLTAMLIDYVHANSFDIDYDGNILLSSRHMDEVTKININTGNIVWRFGLNCENNMFTIDNDNTGFSHQHDVRSNGNGRITVYDNGNNHDPQQSSARRYYLDGINMQASLEWTYGRDGLYAPATGSFRTLDDGRKLIGWGTHAPLNVTELYADNSLSFDLMLPEQVASYRAIKQRWQTNLFSAYKELSLGNFAGYSTPKQNYLLIRNPGDDTICITSTYNHLQAYTVVSDLPLIIPPQDYAYLTIQFDPPKEGDYADRLTLNVDNAANTERIARQVNLMGMYNDTVPSVFIDPPQGSVDVDPGTRVEISFDTPVQLVSGLPIGSGDIAQLVLFHKENYSGTPVAFSGTINAGQTVITLYPAGLLEEEQQYYVRLLDSCVQDLSGHVITNAEVSYFITGLATDNRTQDNPQISVYPNPCNEMLAVDTRTDGAISLLVMDMQGRPCLQQTSHGPKAALDTRSLSTGTYLLKVITEWGSEVVRFIRQ